MRSAEPDRNAPCPCGSGRKFKRCCEARWRRQRTRNARIVRWLAIALAVGVLGGAVVLIASLENGDPSDPQRVWSPEHGHWHDAP